MNDTCRDFAPPGAPPRPQASPSPAPTSYFPSAPFQMSVVNFCVQLHKSIEGIRPTTTSGCRKAFESAQVINSFTLENVPTTSSFDDFQTLVQSTADAKFSRKDWTSWNESVVIYICKPNVFGIRITSEQEYELFIRELHRTGKIGTVKLLRVISTRPVITQKTKPVTAAKSTLTRVSDESIKATADPRIKPAKLSLTVPGENSAEKTCVIQVEGASSTQEESPSKVITPSSSISHAGDPRWKPVVSFAPVEVPRIVTPPTDKSASSIEAEGSKVNAGSVDVIMKESEPKTPHGQQQRTIELEVTAAIDKDRATGASAQPQVIDNRAPTEPVTKDDLKTAENRIDKENKAPITLDQEAKSPTKQHSLADADASNPSRGDAAEPTSPADAKEARRTAQRAQARAYLESIDATDHLEEGSRAQVSKEVQKESHGQLHIGQELIEALQTKAVAASMEIETRGVEKMALANGSAEQPDQAATGSPSSVQPTDHIGVEAVDALAATEDHQSMPAEPSLPATAEAKSANREPVGAITTAINKEKTDDGRVELQDDAQAQPQEPPTTVPEQLEATTLAKPSKEPQEEVEGDKGSQLSPAKEESKSREASDESEESGASEPSYLTQAEVQPSAQEKTEILQPLDVKTSEQFEGETKAAQAWASMPEAKKAKLVERPQEDKWDPVAFAKTNEETDELDQVKQLQVDTSKTAQQETTLAVEESATEAPHCDRSAVKRPRSDSSIGPNKSQKLQSSPGGSSRQSFSKDPRSASLQSRTTPPSSVGELAPSYHSNRSVGDVRQPLQEKARLNSPDDKELNSSRGPYMTIRRFQQNYRPGYDAVVRHLFEAGVKDMPHLSAVLGRYNLPTIDASLVLLSTKVDVNHLRMWITKWKSLGPEERESVEDARKDFSELQTIIDEKKGEASRS